MRSKYAWERIFLLPAKKGKNCKFIFVKYFTKFYKCAILLYMEAGYGGRQGH